jgi:hypothetical protein
MAGIGNVQLKVGLTGNDVFNMRLNRTATGMGTASGGFIWNPTTKAIISKEESEKQNTDNLTFLFEYRALLNSRVQTLITQLSNALASDLDVAMSAANVRWSRDRAAMNGISNPTTQDAGAARATYNFMMGWMTGSDANGNAALDVGANNFVSASAGYNSEFTSASNNDLRALGTATLTQIVSDSGRRIIDSLDIRNLGGGGTAPTYEFINLSSGDALATNYNVLNDSFEGPLGQAALTANAKNLMQKVLFDTLSSIEFRPVLTSGLMKNLIIASSSSLATGSQIQASFNISYTGTADGGLLDISLDKFTAFYHS